MLFFLVSYFVLAAVAQQQQSQADLTDFSGGLNTYQSPLSIKDNQAQQANNVILDKTGSVDRRQGYTKLNNTKIGDGSTDVNAIYRLEQSNGNQYCIAFSSTNGYYSSDGCQSFTSFVSTLTRNNDVNCDTYSDNIYCVNNQYNFYWSGLTGAGTSINLANAPASMKYIRVHRNRCFAAGGTSFPSRLFFSALGDCTAWATTTDYFDVSTNNGDVITGIGPTFYDMLIIYKKYSTWALKGVDNNSFVLVNVSIDTGAKNHRSIQNMGPYQLFDSVGPNGGQPGIYGFNGVVIQEMSKTLRNELDLADSFRQTTSRKTIDTSGDWSSGTFDKKALSATRQLGFIWSSDTIKTDSQDADWRAGTTTQIIINTSSNVTSAAALTNTGFEKGDFTNWTTNSNILLRGGGFPSADCTIGWSTGSFSASECVDATAPDVEIDVIDGVTSALVSSANYVAPIACTDSFVNTDGASGSTLKLKILFKGTGSGSITSNAFNKVDRVNYVVNGRTGGCITTGGSPKTSYVDFPEPFYIKTGTFTSSCFDVSISSPIWGLFKVTQTSTSADYTTFQTQVATSCTGTFDSAITITPDARVTSAAKEFFKYTVNFGSSGSTRTATVNQISYEASSTGTWRSPELFLSNNILASSGWGLFQTAQTLTGSSATVVYDLRISSFSGGASAAVPVAIVPGNTITNSTGAYAIVTATMSIYAATETAKIDNIVINWNEGAGAKSASAAVFSNRYHYGVQKQNGTVNDTMYILDTNGAWVKWTDVQPRMLNVINQQLMMSGSTTTTGGFVYQLYNTDSDDGGSFQSIYQTKDFDFGNITHLHAVDGAYITTESNSGSLNIDILGDSGQSDQSFSVSMSTGATYRTNYVAATNRVNARTFSFKFSNLAASAPWRLHRAGFIWRDLGFQRPF